MFSAKTPAAAKEQIRSKMLATPQHVMVSAMESSMEPPKTGESYRLPAFAIMVGRPGINSYGAQLKSLFPNLQYEEWPGYGHFLMLEDPERFNGVLADFLVKAAARKK